MNLITRSQWGATAPTGPKMRLPVSRLWLHHSVTQATHDPLRDMRTLERIGVQRFGRFSYSYAVHPNGTVLIGAGDTVGAHTAGQNSTSLGIVLIGNYEANLLQVAQLAAVIDLIRWLRDTGRATRDSAIGGHRDVKSTACPGRYAYDQLPWIRLQTSQPSTKEWFDMATKDELKDAIREVQREATYVMAVEGRQYLIDESLRLASYIPDGVSLNKLVDMYGARDGSKMTRSELRSRYEVDDA